ncbi:NFACT RNA binding domain-containing protein [Metasolibacillus meyeri]|uniref:Rqc2 homolog RqcH n=1 Tax=Metasolibacillus meyeri TaxID=1071052 RepID=A0AAW9NXD5_9BACL|nr:NFACT RNA binding domain-containing protein [Metasolibacillus meyeri]MEC1179410.1 NFACT RNA binding domain-containing protein [Metasolibacillus meyeri]
MAFDGLFTRAMAQELQQLTTGRITKIHQPNAMEVVLHIRANGANHKLIISIHPSYARIHVTEQAIDNPAEPPMFCMLLRKHLEGGFIHAITQDGTERILHMLIESKNEIGDPIMRKLIIEIMGRHSNCILVDADNDKILDSLKHLPPSLNSYRTVLPGQAYIAPPAQHKVNPYETTGEDFFAEPKSAKEVVAHFAGFSPLHAEELLARLSHNSTVFQPFLQELTTAANPTYVEVDGKVSFSPSDLTHLAGHVTTYPTLGSLLDRVFFARAERERVKQQAGDLERWLSNEVDKLKLKIKKLKKDYEQASKLDQLQLYGELLMANIYQFAKGQESVTVENYYNGETVTIAINPRKTPIDNAQHYFQRYNKAKNALVMIEEQLKKTSADIDYFEMLAQQVTQAAPSDIEEIREELAEQGFLRLRASKKKKKPTKPMPEQFVSSTGIVISVGKNNKQNDFLTFKLAKKNEIWLHTKDIPGSHVVIHSETPDETTLHEAAMLSAYFSKARESASVPVDYTEIRQVKKPNGSKPGFVIYFEQKTLYVTPDDELVLKLKKK